MNSEITIRVKIKALKGTIPSYCTLNIGSTSTNVSTTYNDEVGYYVGEVLWKPGNSAGNYEISSSITDNKGKTSEAKMNYEITY